MVEIDGKEYDEGFVKIAIQKQTAEFLGRMRGKPCCPMCGESLYKGANYCDRCGQKVKSY